MVTCGCIDSMRRAVIALILCSFFGGCTAKKGAEIELLDMDGKWISIITVHGFYEDDSAAKDIIRGLQMVSRADGTAVREYRIRK